MSKVFPEDYSFEELQALYKAYCERCWEWGKIPTYYEYWLRGEHW